MPTVLSDDRMKWWRESRFGLFIHWGIYSLLGRGEWVMYNERVPVREYEKLAGQFNPVKFNAEEWVKLAAEAGMKYIVITAKHHDGFSMFKSEVSSFNIVDATPFKRDIMAELAEACRQAGIKLCFYYSHVREWRHPQAQSLEASDWNHFGNYGNFWDYPDECRKNLQCYIDEFDKPQLRELLTQYGPVGGIWFDTPSLIRPEQARDLVAFVKQLQPDCLVNSRVGEHVEVDYYNFGDCEIPAHGGGVDWETPMTICDYWGYNALPGNQYRQTKDIVRHLTEIASLGGNYLLNVGPDALGVVPSEAQERLREVGTWLKRNGEAVYGTRGSPFAVRPSWGRITAGDHRLYLHLYDWRPELVLTGLKADLRIVKAYLLADPARSIDWALTPCRIPGYNRLTVKLPGTAPDANNSVLALETAGEIGTELQLLEDAAGEIILPASMATLESKKGVPEIKVGFNGVTKDWLREDDWLSWQFLLETAGDFAVELTLKKGFYGLWDWGKSFELELEFDGRSVIAMNIVNDIQGDPHQEKTLTMGMLKLTEHGSHRLALKAHRITPFNRQGVTAFALRLIPALKPDNHLT